MSLFKRLQHVAGAVGQKALLDLNEHAIKESSVGQVDGIMVSDASLAQRAPQEFLQATREAMALIKELDPRRHRRVCRHLNYIVNLEITSLGNFERKLKTCHVDYTKYLSGPDHERNVRLYACVIVHEATHGLLEEKLILYDEIKRQRIEGLCHKEEYRFACHFGRDWADRVIGPFRPELWQPYWEGTRKDRLAALWARYREKL